jgi:hypothetical protein
MMVTNASMASALKKLKAVICINVGKDIVDIILEDMLQCDTDGAASEDDDDDSTLESININHQQCLQS